MLNFIFQRFFNAEKTGFLGFLKIYLIDKYWKFKIVCVIVTKAFHKQIGYFHMGENGSKEQRV